MCTALPWLDDLNSVIAEMYISGGTKKKYGCSSRPQLDGTMVQIGEHVSFENPIVAYNGAGEVERAFRGRFRSHPQNDVKTVLECIDVEASDDSISCGSADNSQNQHPSNPPLFGISSPPPQMKVTYRLSQQYGTYFSVHSLLLVTIQLRRGCSEKVRTVTSGHAAAVVPLATSAFTPRVAHTVAVAATAHSRLVAVALAKAPNKMSMATTELEMSGQHLVAGHSPQASSSPVVAEVVRIEELWNGVSLLRFAPVHWSRRLNGLVVSSAAYFFT